MRLVQSKPAPAWLGTKAKGYAVSEVAPPRIFALRTGKAATVQTSEGSFRIKPLDDALPLGAVPLGKATPAITAALRGFARGEQFERGRSASSAPRSTRRSARRTTSRSRAQCDLTSYLPFLRLG